MFEVIKKNKVKMFNLIDDCEDLCSIQEEADTRLILHAKHSLDNGSNSVGDDE